MSPMGMTQIGPYRQQKFFMFNDFGVGRTETHGFFVCEVLARSFSTFLAVHKAHLPLGLDFNDACGVGSVVRAVAV